VTLWWLDRRPSLRARLLSAGIAALGAGAFVAALYARQTPETGSDFDQSWIAARALLAGGDPYAAVVAAGWPWPLYYPLPAVLVAVPFTLLSMAAARMVFAGLGAGALAYAMTGRAWWGLAVVVSAPFLDALTSVQWSPLLTAAALLPALGWALAAKPTIGLALWVAYPRWQTAAAVGAIVVASLVALPEWPRLWLAAAAGADHIRAPILRPGGFLLLLALLKWRRPEARLLAVLAGVPQSPAMYEALPLFLAPSSAREALGLALLSHVTYAAIRLLPAAASFAEGYQAKWPIMLVLLYLPVLIVVLRRPNQAPDHSTGLKS